MSALGTEDRHATQITELLLNAKIMELLRARPSCGDARSVMLVLDRDPDAPCNWRIGHFDPGQGDRYICKVQLRRIYETICRDYEMIGES